MAITNWTTTTTTDPRTGQTTAIVTVYGPQSQAYQLGWVSGTPPLPIVAGASASVINDAAAGAFDVQAEAAVAGAQLLAMVNNGTANAPLITEANPDPAEV